MSKDDLASADPLLACAIRETKEEVDIAVPVCHERVKRELEAMAEVDDVLSCATVPTADFYAAGQFYDTFGQGSDDEVVAIMQKHYSSSKQ